MSCPSLPVFLSCLQSSVAAHLVRVTGSALIACVCRRYDPKHSKSIRNGIWGWKLVPEGESGTDGTPWDVHIETAEGVLVQEDEGEAADVERV